MDISAKTRLADQLALAIRTQDRDGLAGIVASDVVWTLPGSREVSGEAKGVEGILNRSRLLAEFGVNIEVLHVVYGLSGFGLLLHNTGSYRGRTLDEFLTTVAQVADGRIAHMDSYISDVPMLDAYFAA
jgi:ketosteroid isomerase-like protein